MSHLNFVSANCSQRDLPYRFRQLAGGVFTTHSSYGSIQLSHFSGMGLIGRLLRTQRSYCAHLYHTKNKVDEWRFYFVITQDLDANNKVCCRHTQCVVTLGVMQATFQMQFVGEYYGRFARKEATLRVIFTDGEITLNIPDGGLVTEDGWRITPFSHPTVSKHACMDHWRTLSYTTVF